MFKNAGTLVGGRGFLTLARFAIAALIINATGTERYGEYSLVLGLLFICEWAVDFGFGDIFVREICRTPDTQDRLLHVLTKAKVLQVFVGYGILAVVLWAMSYPPHIVEAGLVGGLELFFYGGILIYRAVFKIKLTLEREVLAEVLSIASLFGMLWAACAADASLSVMLGCFAASRALYFAGVVVMGRRVFPLGIHQAKTGDVRRAFWETLPLGVTGMFVVLYDALEPLMLSKLATFRDVGLYSGIQRFVLLGLFILGSLGFTMYPILSAAWGRRMEEFRSWIQLGAEVAVVLAGAVVCVLQVGPELFLGLLGDEMPEAALALRLLTGVLLLRAVTTVVGPVIVIAGRQTHTLWIAVLAVGSKAVLLAVLIPSYGYLGAACAYLAAEALCGFLPTVLVVQHYAGFRFDWRVFLRIAIVAAVCIGVPVGLDLVDEWWGVVIAGVLYFPLALATGAIRASQLRGLVSGINARFGRGQSSTRT